MSHPILKYSKSKVDKAGNVLIQNIPVSSELEWAMDVLSNWRGCHSYPVNTFQATLRKRLKLIDHNALVAQRLKRTPSVISKLKRFHKMKLSRMQDIGGLRAVVRSLKELRLLEKAYTSPKVKLQHDLVSIHDYVTSPKSDGYRSIHLVYRYNNLSNPIYNGLSIEMQFRTKLQHSWATAVETISIMTNQALKSNQGKTEWLEFFKVVGASFCVLERTPMIPGFEKIEDERIFQMVIKQENQLRVLEKLEGFNHAVKISGNTIKGKYQLIVLNSSTKVVEVRTFKEDQLDIASENYLEQEKKSQNGEALEVVLVSTGSIENLKKAYPNYFLDTHDFIKNVRRIMKKVSK